LINHLYHTERFHLKALRLSESVNVVEVIKLILTKGSMGRTGNFLEDLSNHCILLAHLLARFCREVRRNPHPAIGLQDRSHVSKDPLLFGKCQVHEQPLTQNSDRLIRLKILVQAQGVQVVSGMIATK
jgi:hypothetical protein